MATKEDTAPETDGAPAEGDAAATGKKDPLAFLAFLPAKLRLPALIGAPVLLILIIVLGLVLGGVFNKKVPKTAEGADSTMTDDAEAGDAKDGKDKKDEKSVYYNLPDMLVNLDSRGRKQSVLKMSISLELTSADDLKVIEEKVPRVMDEFQVFLREMRIEDLRGSAGIYRLRQELLSRVKPAVAPIKVKDVLFKELLVQ